jgi:hypothetical protein
MPILSEFIQGAVRARGSYLQGKRVGEKERRDAEFAREREEREKLDSEAQRRHLDRLSRLRDPNDPDVLEQRHRYDMEREEQSENRSLVREMRSAMAGDREQADRMAREKGEKTRQLNAIKPPLMGYQTPEDSLRADSTRKALTRDTAALGDSVRARRGEINRKQSIIEDIIPGMKAAPRPQSDTYERGGEQVPNAARQELSALSRQFIRAVNTLKAKGDTAGVREAQRIYRAKQAEIIGRHRGA